MRTADGHVHSIQYLLQTTLPYLLKVQLAGLPGLRLLYALYQYYCSSVHRRVADWSEAG